MSGEILGLPSEWGDSDGPILGASAAVVPGRCSGPPGRASPLRAPIVSAFAVRSHFGEAEVGLCEAILSERPVGGPPASLSLGALFSPGRKFSGWVALPPLPLAVLVLPILLSVVSSRRVEMDGLPLSGRAIRSVRLGSAVFELSTEAVPAIGPGAGCFTSGGVRCFLVSVVLVMVLVLLGSGVCGLGEEGTAGVLPGGAYGFLTMTGLIIRLVAVELVPLFEPVAGGVGADGVDGLLTMIGPPMRLERPIVRVPDEENGGLAGVGATGADAGPLDGLRTVGGDCGCAGVGRLRVVIVGGRLGVVPVGGLLGAVVAGGELGAVRLGAGVLGLGVLLEPPRDEEKCEPGPDGALATRVGAGAFTATAGCEALGVSLAIVVAGGAFAAGLGVFEGAGAVWGGACC